MKLSKREQEAARLIADLEANLLQLAKFEGWEVTLGATTMLHNVSCGTRHFASDIEAFEWLGGQQQLRFWQVFTKQVTESGRRRVARQFRKRSS